MQGAYHHHICMPMPWLQKIIEKQFEKQVEEIAVPLEWVLYNLNAAKYITNYDFENTDDNKKNFEFMEAYLTVMLSDPSFNCYRSDNTVVGAQDSLNCDDKMIQTLSLQCTESIQRPLSGKKMAPDDCEDWAMLILMMFKALQYYCDKSTEVTKNNFDLFDCSKINDALKHDLQFLLNTTKKILQKSKFEVYLVTGGATNPSVTEPLDLSTSECCGHEFAFLKDCHSHATVLEGTHWTKIVLQKEKDKPTPTNEIIRNLDKEKMINSRQQIDVTMNGPRNYWKYFWRIMFTLNDQVIVTVQKNKDKNVCYYGGILQDVISHYTEEQTTKDIKMQDVISHYTEEQTTKDIKMQDFISHDPEKQKTKDIVFLDTYKKDTKETKNTLIPKLAEIYENINLPKSKEDNFKTYIQNKQWQNSPIVEFKEKENQKTHNYFFVSKDQKENVKKILSQNKRTVQYVRDLPFMSGFLCKYTIT
jgi:hypothetical protein